MVRPCDTCRGSGTVWEKLDNIGHDDALPCPDCVDMPWLVCNNCGGDGKDYRPNMNMNNCSWCGGTREGPGLGKFKPDRSTVLRWCQVHRCIATHVDRCDVNWATVQTPFGDCDIVWIENPTPLKEADDD